MKKERINEIWGVFYLLLGLFTLASLFFSHAGDVSFYSSHPSLPVKNLTGLIGAYVAFGLKITFGTSAFLIPILFLVWSSCFFHQKVPEKKIFKVIGLAIALFSTSTLVAISLPPQLRFEHGGAVGYLAGNYLLQYFGHVGSYILAGSCLLLSMLLATDFLLYPLVKDLFARMGEMTGDLREKFDELQEEADALKESIKAKPKSEKRAKEKKEKQKEPPVVMPDVPLRVKKYQPEVVHEEETIREKAKRAAARASEATQEKKKAREETPRKVEYMPQEAKNEKDDSKFDSVISSGIVKEGEYAFPPLDLLKRPKAAQVSDENLQENSKVLESTLAQFGIQVKVVEVEQGPVITRYELLPAPGVKVSSITALEHDLALALKATSIRLIAPIPGKSAVGVEVPNSISSTVYLRELIESQLFRTHQCTLPLTLGKDTSGKPLVPDLTSMPHLLIAGTTGSGKTVCVNSIITGLVYNCTPNDLKFVMVDPKMVELAVYNKLPHMLSPVVTDVRKAYQTLNWVVNEMENRYKLFATVGVRNIKSFNERDITEEEKAEIEATDSENVIPARIPYIVLIIDELADLMMVAQDKVESAITRLAQLSRAVGIHLILATQRPSVDVITGVIKANFPARISFKVASKVDSRTVLDAIGADQLIGRGDMLFMQPGDAKPVRGQAALVVDEEINGVVEFTAAQAQPEFHPEILSTQEGKATQGAVGEKDELFDEAVRVVLETRQASTSNLQRRLRLGYTRAARIIDQMEAEGLIGPAQGAKPRDIYVGQESVPIAEEE